MPVLKSSLQRNDIHFSLWSSNCGKLKETTAWKPHIQKITCIFSNHMFQAWSTDYNAGTSVCTKQEKLHSKSCLCSGFVFLPLTLQSSCTQSASLLITWKVWLLSSVLPHPNIIIMIHQAPSSLPTQRKCILHRHFQNMIPQDKESTCFCGM